MKASPQFNNSVSSVDQTQISAEKEFAASAISTKLFQEAFSSLSLTDKCAFSLSIDKFKEINKTKEPFDFSFLSDNSMNDSTVNDQEFSSTGVPEDISEMQSVLSETDKESLDAAMSMMGHQELRQVEDEVFEFLFILFFSLN